MRAAFVLPLNAVAEAAREPPLKINSLEAACRVLRVRKNVEDDRDNPRQSLGIRWGIVGWRRSELSVAR
jgi:hypothetical protein